MYILPSDLLRKFTEKLSPFISMVQPISCSKIYWVVNFIKIKSLTSMLIRMSSKSSSTSSYFETWIFFCSISQYKDKSIICLFLNLIIILKSFLYLFNVVLLSRFLLWKGYLSKSLIWYTISTIFAFSKFCFRKRAKLLKYY